MKKQAKVLFFAALSIAVFASGCASSPTPVTGANGSLTAGNWLLIENSVVDQGSCSLPADTTQPACVTDGGTWTPNLVRSQVNVDLRGPLQISGAAVNANFNVSGSSHLPPTADFTGSADSGSVNLAATVFTNGMTITGTVHPGSNFDGTYCVTAPGTPTCAADNAYNAANPGMPQQLPVDQGIVYGTYVPPVKGDWSGSLSRNIGGPIGVSASLQQADATPQNTFPLSGTLSLSNDACFTSGTIDSTQSYVTGEVVVIVANTAGSSITLNAYLINPTLSTAMQVTQYAVNGCVNDFGTGTLTAN